MPVYDFECDECGFIEERVLPISECNRDWQCSCGGVLHRIMTLSGVNIANQDAEWIRTIAAVVDKDGDEHDQRFLASGMTRADLDDWKRGKGVRNLEPGETIKTPPMPDDGKIAKEVWEKHQKRMMLTLD
jgi:putative FmdB family regulatory protein